MFKLRPLFFYVAPLLFAATYSATAQESATPPHSSRR